MTNTVTCLLVFGFGRAPELHELPDSQRFINITTDQTERFLSRDIETKYGDVRLFASERSPWLTVEDVEAIMQEHFA